MERSKDPVSGHLDFYNIDADDNRELFMNKKWGVAHTAYWEHPSMYEDIYQRFFGWEWLHGRNTY